ncbi:MAG: hypothetical protein BGO43_02210 [Gammaproteobacteria bacterium 39-13]|nr:MAG: hypothetical protein BGO43_02210 [Gammaproteobacteria bacterium 39-13]
MYNTKIIFKFFLIFILGICSAGLLLDIFDMLPHYHRYIEFAVFSTALIFISYYLLLGSLDNALTFIIIAGLFNPIHPVNMGHLIWKILEFPVFFLFIHKMYLLYMEDEIKEAEKIASVLDQYFKELEHTISYLTYHQASIYIRKRYTLDCEILDDRVKWQIPTLPNIEFQILTEFYSLGKNSKGGVTAICLNKYVNIEVHQNFNLTDPVKYTVIEEKSPTKKTSRHANRLKQILITRYNYLEL